MLDLSPFVMGMFGEDISLERRGCYFEKVLEAGVIGVPDQDASIISPRQT